MRTHRPRFPRIFLLSPLLVLALFAPPLGCHSHEHAGDSADEYIVDCETQDSGAGASDENFVAFVNAQAAGKVMSDDALAPVLTAPAAGSSLSATTPPTFTFTTPQAANPAPRRHIARSCQAESTSTAMTGARQAWWKAAAVAAAQLFSLEGTAHAHCPAFTGENYFFRLTVDGSETPLYTAVLSVPSFTPDVAIWSKAMSGRAGQTVVLTLLRGVFFKGAIMEGPFAPTQKLTFSVAP